MSQKKTCIKCGSIFESRNCNACNRARTKKWRAENSDKAKADVVKWRAENPEKMRLASRARYVANKEKMRAERYAWVLANPDKRKISDATYRANNKDKIRSVKADYRIANIEKVKAGYEKWRSLNPESLRVNAQNRRARKRNAGGRLSKNLSIKLFEFQKGRCACCGKPLGDNYHMDHIIPLALGGANEDWNIQLLKQRCNNQKHAKHPVEFMQSRGYLL